jgi:hypothetical protein
MFSTTELAEEFKRNIKKIQEGARLIKNGAFQQGSRTLHFFNRKNRFKPRDIKLFGSLPLYTIYPTSEHSLRNYIQQLKDEISQGVSENRYILIGKILHIVQDMSSPANVVPVYRSPRSGDSFEDRLNSKMGLYLSHFNFNQDRFNRVCECSVGEDCLEYIYQDAAQKTLDRITKSDSEFSVEVNGETIKAGWDLFWEDDDPTTSFFYKCKLNSIKGFGRYGPLGRHFGQERVDISKNRYVVNNRIYDDLCNFFVKKSIEDSLRVLVCIDNRLNNYH